MVTYMSQIPVLRFDSAKYDLNLIKRVLAKHPNMHEETGAFLEHFKKVLTYLRLQFRFPSLLGNVIWNS